MFSRLRMGSALLACAGGGAGFVYYKNETDRGFSRALRLYSELGPVVVHYRWTELRHKLQRPSDAAAAQEWRELDAKYAAFVVDTCAELQGMYTKYGQIGAGMTNTFSSTWIEELRKLEDAVPPRPKAVVMKTIREETGQVAEALFSSFDDEPLGSASIGQVHRATLRRDGSEVCVKVQYPDARTLFMDDMKTIRGFLTLAAPEQVIILDELERSFENEFDYRQEAANLVAVSSNMREAGFLPREVVVPRPLTDLCTQRLLVMELLPGCKLVDGLRRYGRTLAARAGKTLEHFEDDIRRRIEEEGIPPRYEGPSAAQIEAYVQAMRWRDFWRNLGARIYNTVVAWPLGLERLEHRVTTQVPPNAPRMMDTLMRVHGHQLLVDGVFNADTHAGNFMMLDDGRIGLIDYGATKRLTRGERLITCVLYAALARKDTEMITMVAINGGYKSKYNDPDCIMKACRFGFDTFGRDLLQGKNAQEFMDDLYAADPWEEVADNLVMAQFLSIRLRTVGMQMLCPVVCSDWWGKLAEEVLVAEGLPYDSWTIETMNEVTKGQLRIAKGVA